MKPSSHAYKPSRKNKNKKDEVPPRFELRSLDSHPRRPRGSQSGRKKRRDESFQARAEEDLGIDSIQTISKRLSECRFLIGHKNSFLLLCPMGERHLLSFFMCSFMEAMVLSYLSGSFTKVVRERDNFNVYVPYQKRRNCP